MTRYVSSHRKVCKKLESEMDMYVATQKLDMNAGNILCKTQKGRMNVITDQENQLRVMSLMKDRHCQFGKYTNYSIIRNTRSFNFGLFLTTFAFGRLMYILKFINFTFIIGVICLCTYLIMPLSYLLYAAYNGWTDEDSEGKWISERNHTLARQNFQPWSSGEPNGEERENCGRLYYEQNEWEDVSCSNQHCIICDYPLHITYNVRGLCASTLFDTHYAWIHNVNDELLRGYTKSVMEWKEEGCRINVYNNPDTYAMFNESRNTPYMGTKYWNIVNDACRYDKTNGAEIHNNNTSRILLSLNTCGPNEYNCNDGTW